MAQSLYFMMCSGHEGEHGEDGAPTEFGLPPASPSRPSSPTATRKQASMLDLIYGSSYERAETYDEVMMRCKLPPPAQVPFAQAVEPESLAWWTALDEAKTEDVFGRREPRSPTSDALSDDASSGPSPTAANVPFGEHLLLAEAEFRAASAEFRAATPRPLSPRPLSPRELSLRDIDDEDPNQLGQ